MRMTGRVRLTGASRIRATAGIRLPAALAVLWAALAWSGAAAASGPTVILISLDGTTPEAVRAAGMETVGRLAEGGATASRLTPVFPTNTFPNHATLATGVAPEVHGIVNNVFLDPQRGLFDYDGDPTWIEVEPIWSIAARHDIVSAAFHWVGSEGPWRNGRGPRHWKRFDSSTTEAEKVEQILAWLDIGDPDLRPRLITAWFHGADGAGHRFGPDSSQVKRTLRAQDRELARLVAGLEERGVLASTTLLLVSDHGMAEVKRHVDLDAALRRARIAARVLGGGGFASVSLEDPGDAVRVVALALELGLEAHPRGAFPSSLRLGHIRFGDVAALAPLGTAIARERRLKPAMRGAHGYRPREPAMGALFLAAGRGAPAGARLGPVSALDVAPTVLALLGISPPEWMEGRPIARLIPAPGEAAAPAGSDGGGR
jgi:predicted AlkP superfamily pyrophosphatase or phosphodiesterase